MLPKALVVGSAPHIFSRQSTSSLIWGTALALLPAAAWGIYRFGVFSATPFLIAILSALVAEAIVSGLRGKFTLFDGSAFLTGLLVGMAMPPGVSMWIPFAASLFAVVIVKGCFGGLGSNWMNPALAGIAFSVLSWPQAMKEGITNAGLSSVQAISGATPLTFLGGQGQVIDAGSDPMILLKAAGAQISNLDKDITGFLNQILFSRIDVELPTGYLDMLLGNKPGASGEISGILLLAASVVLLSNKVIRWEIPASIIGGSVLLAWTFGGLPFGTGLFSGDALYYLFSGSLLLVALFMAPDPVTSPSSKIGMLLFGFSISGITFFLRAFGSVAEGTAFAVIIMNCFVPIFSRLRANPQKRADASGGI